jgi:hypothetical protein
MIAVITRTSNRPKYFNRCYNSVKNTNVVTSHHVLYDSVNDISYLSDKKVIPHFIDKNKFLSYNEPAPSTARPPMLSLHNLYFMVKLAEKIRCSIIQDSFLEDKKSFMEKYFNNEK